MRPTVRGTLPARYADASAQETIPVRRRHSAGGVAISLTVTATLAAACTGGAGVGNLVGGNRDDSTKMIIVYVETRALGGQAVGELFVKYPGREPQQLTHDTSQGSVEDFEVSKKGGIVTFTSIEYVNHEPHTWVKAIKPDDSEPRKLIDSVSFHGDSDYPLDLYPPTIKSDIAVSPDGGQVAFVTVGGYNGSREQLHVINTDGSGYRKAYDPIDGRESVGSPVFSPDGNQIAFIGGMLEPASDGVYLMNTDGSMRRLVIPAADLIGDIYNDGYLKGLTWLPKGARMAVLADSSPNDKLYIADARVGGSADLVLEKAITAPAFSPDGTMIAYSGKLDDQLFVMNVDGSGVRQIIDLDNEPRTLSGQAFTPDGKSILFGAMPVDTPPTAGDESNLGLFKVDLEGGHAEKIDNMLPSRFQVASE